MMLTFIVQALIMLAPIAIITVAFAPTDIKGDRVPRTFKFPDTFGDK